MKTIPLTQCYFALIDDADYADISQHKWFADVDRNQRGEIKNVYAARKIRTGTGHKTERLHRVLLGVSDPKIHVDHEDRNGLNCQRSNLRVATALQNRLNSKVGDHNTTGFKGVRYHSRSKRYEARITVGGNRVSLGYTLDPIEAAKLYDSAAIFHFGKFARLNF